MSPITAPLAPVARQRVFSDLGVVSPGALLHSYVAGSASTPLATYSDRALTTPNANPIVASSGGLFGPIYLTPGQSYQFVLTTSTGAAIWSQDYVSGPVNWTVYAVEDYGAVGNGIANDTAAFAAAIAAVPASGGTVLAAKGPYAVNVVLDKAKVTLAGSHQGRLESTATPGGLVAYDLTLPILTLSTDATRNEGMAVENLEINGQGTASYGLKIRGGTYSCVITNVSIANCTKKCLWITSGAVQPIAYLTFSGLFVQPTSSAACEHAILVEAGDVAQYAAAIFFSNARVSGVNFGFAVELAGVSGAVWANTWIQCYDTHGVKLTQPFAEVPRLRGYGLFLDSAVGTDTLLSIPFAATTSSIGHYVEGFVGIDGKVSLGGTLYLNESVAHLPDLAGLIKPYIQDAAYFNDSANPTNKLMRIYSEPTPGANILHLEVSGASSLLSLDSLTTGEVRDNAPAVTAPFYSLVNSAAGTHKWIANGVNGELRPGTAGYLWLVTNDLHLGTTGTGLIVHANQAGSQLEVQAASLVVANTYGVKGFAADGTTPLAFASYNASNNLFLGQGTTGTSATLFGPSTINFAIGASTVAAVHATDVVPQVDNVMNLGLGGARWKEVFAVAGAINTSDAREKTDIAPIDDRVLDAWAEVPYVQYRWLTAVAAKGDAARIHHGVIAQQIVAAFTAKGLDATRYGIVCHDTWEAHDERTGINDQGEDVYRAVPAGDRYAIRPDECQVLEAALQRRTVARLSASVLQIARGQW